MGAPAAAEDEEGSASSTTIGRAPQKWSARGKEEVQHPLPVNAVRGSWWCDGVEVQVAVENIALKLKYKLKLDFKKNVNLKLDFKTGLNSML